MPYKNRFASRHHFKKQPAHARDWPTYNASLKKRGDLTIWLSADVIENWYEPNRIYDGSGSPILYSDMAIVTAHEIRQVFKLPLRQCEGFINSLFQMLKTDLRCPSYSILSKRLKKLNLKQPCYRYVPNHFNEVKAIAIDSTGLKCYGEEEWRSEQYGLKTKKKWRKLHIAVDNNHIIQNSELSESHVQDKNMVKKLISPIHKKVRQVTADGAYDNNSTYQALLNHFPHADLVIPPQKDAIYDPDNHFFRNRNLLERKCYGSIGWQKRRSYGRRNHSELAIQRYKKILGNRLHARDIKRQQQEIIIGCSVLNKMILITLAEIRLKF